jgi:hypothetical protein
MLGLLTDLRGVALFFVLGVVHYAKSRKAFKCCVIRNYEKIRKLRKLVLLLVVAIVGNK